MLYHACCLFLQYCPNWISSGSTNDCTKSSGLACLCNLKRFSMGGGEVLRFSKSQIRVWTRFQAKKKGAGFHPIAALLLVDTGDKNACTWCR